MGRWMADWGKLSTEGGKGIYTKRQRVESGDNLIALWCTGSWTWRKVKDNRISVNKLLVARN